MKHICTITDKEITGSDALSSATPRIAVGVVLFDDNNNIALSYIGAWGEHGLPGGGVDDGEDFISAVKREAWEETGCQCEIIEEIGATFENRGEHDFVQEKYHYTARVIGQKGKLHLEDYEVESKTTVRWYPLEQAFQILSEFQPNNIQQEFIKRRDLAVLKEVVKQRSPTNEGSLHIV